MSLFMPTDKVDILIDHLKNNKYRVGIWLLSPENLGKESLMAVHIGASAVDLAKLYQEGLDPQARFSALAPDRLSDLLEKVYSAGGSNIALGYNLDLLLSRLNSHQRAEFWNIALGNFPYPPRMLILTLPAHAFSILPQGLALEHWKDAGKVLDGSIE